ncbi:hypothetical protein QOZ80_5AG0407550 [Eleusine coracana subsp. coracana]|nr:hypothetical protein QOZ80_5AG0407550 [Eleusine coracana subsp. coracana]
MERNKKEKSKSGSAAAWVVAAGAVAVTVGAAGFFMLSRIGDGAAEQDQTTGRTMKAPDTGGERISRDKFEADPKNYFKTSRIKGPKAAVDAFK